MGDAYDFESVSNYSDSHELLAVITAIHHEGVGETLDDWAVGLAEALDSITPGRVRDVDGGPYLDVVTVRKVESARKPQIYSGRQPSRNHKRNASSSPDEIKALSRVLTLMRCLGLRRPRMTIC